MPIRKRNEIQTLYEAFAGTPRDFSAAPFVFLNDDIDESAIGDILEGLSTKGFARIVLSPGTGLSVPFPSGKYWRKLRPILERARELSLSVWITCDYNRPAGTGAGHLLLSKPKYCAQGLVFRTRRHPHPNERVIGTYLLRKGSVTHPAEHLAPQRRLIASVAQAYCPALSAADRTQPRPDTTGYLDILNRDAVGHYIKTVLEPLKTGLAPYLGNTVIGILIESPQAQCPFPWTNSLPDLFEKRYGYDIVPHLVSLVRDVGNFGTVRADYYRLIGELTHGYYDAIHTWARTHGLLFSSTIGGERFIEKIPHTQGNLYAALSEMDVPGTGYCCNGTHYLNDTPASLLRNYTPKFVSSIAGTGDHTGALAAVWEGEGWGVPPRLLKHTIDCGLSLGITSFFVRGVLASIAGPRKRDFPPSYYVQIPYWDNITVLSDYIARNCLMMNAGHPKADILVFLPIMSLWMNTLGFGRLSKDGTGIVTGFIDLIGRLISDHRDFDFFFEEMIERRLARFGDGFVTIGPNRYTTLIIPWATHISGTILSFIESAQQSGVNVVFVGRYPSVLGKPQTPTVGIGLTMVKDAGTLVHYLRLKAPKQVTVYGGNSDRFIHQRRALPGADIYFFSYLGDERFTGTLTLAGTGTTEAWDPENGVRYLISDFEVTDNGIRFPVTFEPGKSWIYVIHSEHSDTTYALPDPPKHRLGEFYFPGRWKVEYRSEPMFRIDSFRLVRYSRPAPFPRLSDLWKDTRFGIASKVIISAVRVFTESAGRLYRIRKRVRYRSYTAIERQMPLYFTAARILGLSLTGLSRHQQIDLIADATRYMGLFFSTPLPPEGAEFEMEATFIAAYVPHRISLVWEDTGEPTEIFVNGSLVSDRAKRCFLWEKNNRTADLSGIVRWGTNQITIRSRQAVYPSMLPALQWMEPIVLAGDFDVKQDIITAKRETKRHLVWGGKRAGNYSGAVTYRCLFRLPKRFAGKRAILDLGDVRVASRVVLNGLDLGARLWPPYRYEITDALNPGENEIAVTVENTAENLLGIPLLSGIVSDPKIAFYDPQ